MKIPMWARLVGLFLVFSVVFLLGQLRGERIGDARHQDYLRDQSQAAQKVTDNQAKVVVKTEIEYRDRIKTVYVKGDEIIKEVPIYVTQTDNDRCTVNAGFVRNQNAAWTGEPAGPPAESDREPAGVSLAEVAEADAHNATAGLAWKEQALACRQFYNDLKAAREGE